MKHTVNLSMPIYDYSTLTKFAVAATFIVVLEVFSK